MDEKISKLIVELCLTFKDRDGETAPLAMEAANALATQAQEVEQLKADQEDSLREVFRANHRAEAAETRVQELEDELYALPDIEKDY